MADATVTLGLDAAPMRAGLQKATADVSAFSKQVQSGPLGKTGGSNRAAGISMQLQDIAVQAQMGTSALTIFSQQAPQLLSVFGSFGALAGGFAAVGGAAFTFGQKSSEAFRTVLNDAAALNSEIGRLVGSGATLESSLDAFSKLRESQKAISQQTQSRQDGGGIGQMFQEFMAIFGLAEKNYDQTKESEVATLALVKQQARAQNEIVKASANQVMLAKLKASGDDKAVEALEQKLKLEAQIQKIKSFGLDAGAEAKLIENATLISELQKKQAKNTYDVAKNLQEQASATNRLLAPYQQLLNYLDQQKQKQDQINSANKQAKQQSQSKIESQKNFAQSLEDEFRLLTAKASGDDKSVKAVERELAIKERTKSIQQQLGVDAKTALDIATKMQNLADKASGASDSGGRIMGYSSERQGGRNEARGRAAQRAAESAEKRAGAYSRGFEGLDPAYARGDFGYRDMSLNAIMNSDYEAGRYYKPDRPINPTASADAMKANPAGSTSPVVSSIQQLEQTIKAILSVD